MITISQEFHKDSTKVLAVKHLQRYYGILPDSYF